MKLTQKENHWKSAETAGVFIAQNSHALGEFEDELPSIMVQNRVATARPVSVFAQVGVEGFHGGVRVSFIPEERLTRHGGNSNV